MKWIALLAVFVGIITLGIAISYEPGEGVVDGNSIEIKEDENPEEKVTLTFVSSTEYLQNDPNGRTLISLVDYSRNKIVTDCYETIINPDRSTYLGPALMSYDSGEGTYYYGFTTPAQQGIFEQFIECEVGNRNITGGKAFHVHNITDEIKVRINEAEVNLGDSIQNVMDGINCSLNPNITLCTQLGSLLNTSNQLVIQTNISSNISNIVDYLEDINSSQVPIFYTISAPDCIHGSFCPT